LEFNKFFNIIGDEDFIFFTIDNFRKIYTSFATIFRWHYLDSREMTLSQIRDFYERAVEVVEQSNSSDDSMTADQMAAQKGLR
jgi:hypothetical protein